MQRYLRIQQKASEQLSECSRVKQDVIPTESLSLRSQSLFPTIHFVETAPSVIRELPWILLKEHRVLIVCV